MLQRAGVKENHKLIYRLYKQEGLSVRTKKRKRLVSRARAVMAKGPRPNERWSIGFVSDVTWSSRRFRILAVLDDFTPRDPRSGRRLVDRRRPRCSRVGEAGPRTRCSGAHYLRQRTRLHQQGNGNLGIPTRSEGELHQAGEARRERLRRKRKRQAETRMPQSELVPQSPGREPDHRSLDSQL